MRHQPVRAIQVLLLAALFVASGCATKSISKVLADPTQYRDREVQISGEVVDSYSVLGRGFYRVRDNSGQLWVMADSGVPRDGARVKVKGTIREAFNVGGLGEKLPGGLGSAVMMLEASHTVR